MSILLDEKQCKIAVVRKNHLKINAILNKKICGNFYNSNAQTKITSNVIKNWNINRKNRIRIVMFDSRKPSIVSRKVSVLTDPFIKSISYDLTITAIIHESISCYQLTSIWWEITLVQVGKLNSKWNINDCSCRC